MCGVHVAESLLTGLVIPSWVSAQGSEEARMMGYQVVEKVLR